MKTSKLGKILIVALFVMLFALVLTVAAGAETKNVASDADLAAAISGAADGDVLVLGGGTYNVGTITIDKNLTIQGTGTVNGGSADNPLFKIAAGKTVTFGGSVVYKTTADKSDGVYINGTGTTVNFTENVRFETKRHVYHDKTNSYNSTVTVAGSAYFKGSYAIAFEQGTTAAGTKTVTMSGGTFECNHGIVFNADYIDAKATVTGGTITNVDTCFYATNANGNTEITVSGGTFSTKNNQLFMLGGNASSNTLTVTGGTFSSPRSNNNNGAIWFDGGGTNTANLSNASFNVGAQALFGCNSSTLNATLENVTAKCRELMNENSKNGKLTFTVKGTSDITCYTGIFSDGNKDGSSMKLTVAGGTIKAPGIISTGNANKASIAVATTLEITGGTVELDYFSGMMSNLTLTVNGGVLKANGVDIATLNNTSAVAQVGETTYDTLQAAIEAAQPGDTVTILKDLTLSSVVTLNKKLTFTGTDVKVLFRNAQFILANGADITFDGSVTWMGFGIFTNSGTSVLTFKDGHFSSSASLLDMDDQAVVTVTIDGGTYVSTGDLDFTMFQRTDDTDDQTNGATTNMTVNGGKFYAKGASMFRSGNSFNKCLFNITVNGGEFYLQAHANAGTTYFFGNVDWQGAGSLFKINGGTFDATGTDAISIGFYLRTEHAKVQITNGTFKGIDRLIQVERSKDSDGTKSVYTVSGGTFEVGCVLYAYGNNNQKTAEKYTDSNGNKKYDVAEPFTDSNKNGKWDEGEKYTDSNKNGEYDAAEPFTDLNGNKQYDAAVWTEYTTAKLEVKGGTFTVSQYFVYLANNESKSTTAIVVISGGTFNQMPSFAYNKDGTNYGTFEYPVTLDLTISNVTISTTGAFFDFSDRNAAVLKATLNGCTLSAGGRLVGADTKSQTWNITNANITAYERMFNITGAGNVATVTITGGTYTIKPLTANGHALMFYSSSGATSTVTINSGTFKNTSTAAAGTAHVAFFDTNGNNTTLKVTVKDGSFEGHQLIYGGKGTVDLTIEKGTFSSSADLVYLNYDGNIKLTVKGGIFNAGRSFFYAMTTGDTPPKDVGKWLGGDAVINISGSPEITTTENIFWLYDNVGVNLTVDGGTYNTTKSIIRASSTQLVVDWKNGTASNVYRFIDLAWAAAATYVTDPLGKVTDAAMIVMISGGNISTTNRIVGLTNRGKAVVRITGGTFSSTYTTSDGNDGVLWHDGSGSRMVLEISGNTQITSTGNNALFGGSSNASYDITISGGTLQGNADLININGSGHVTVNVTGDADITLTKHIFFDENASGSVQTLNMTGGTVRALGVLPYAGIRNTTTVSATGGTLILSDATAEFSTNHVAKTEDGTTYATLAEAIAAAPAGSTVTLLTDLLITEPINIDKEITISGGTADARITVVATTPSLIFWTNTKADGTVESARFDAYSTFIIKDGAKLTLDGYVDYRDCGFVANCTNGDLTFNSNITVVNGSTSPIVNVANSAGGNKTLNVTIYGGTYSNVNGCLFEMGNKIEGSAAGTTVTNYVIHGGSFSSSTTFGSYDWQGKIVATIHGGSFVGGSNGHFVSNGASFVDVTLNGGSFTGYNNFINGYRGTTTLIVSADANITVSATNLINAASSDNAENASKVIAKIASGTYTLSKHVAYVANNAAGDTSTLELTITGGTFKASGYAINQASGTSTIKISNAKLTGTTADNGEGIVIKGGTTTIEVTNIEMDVKWRLFWFDGGANATLTVNSGIFNSTTNFLYYENAGNLDLLIKNATIDTGKRAFELRTTAEGATTKITVNNMNLTTAEAGFYAYGCSPVITVDNANISATGLPYSKSECFFFDNTCPSVTLTVKAGIYTTVGIGPNGSTSEPGGRFMYGNAKKANYTFGVQGETDQTKLRITTIDQQIFATHGNISDLNLTVYSGTYTVTNNNAIYDANAGTFGQLTIYNGIFRSTSGRFLDLTGSTAAAPSGVDITVYDADVEVGGNILAYNNAPADGVTVKFVAGTYKITGANRVFSHQGGKLTLTVGDKLDNSKCPEFSTGGSDGFHINGGIGDYEFYNFKFSNTKWKGFFMESATSIKVTIHDCDITAEEVGFYFGASCQKVELYLYGGEVSTGHKTVQGAAPNATYVFGKVGGADTDLVMTSDPTVSTHTAQQVFAFHTGSIGRIFNVTVNSGTFNTESGYMFDMNTNTKGSITINGGVFNMLKKGNIIDGAGDGTAPNYIDITIAGGTFNNVNTLIYLAHNFGEVTVSGGTANMTGADTGVIYCNSTGDPPSEVDVTVSGGTFIGAAQLVHFDQVTGKVIISGGTATLSTNRNASVDKAGANKDANNPDNDAYLIYLSGHVAGLKEGSEISGGNYTVTLIDPNTGMIGGNSDGIVGYLTISGGTLNCTNGPLFGWYADWTATISGGTITCKWLVNVNGGACVENITISGNANVTCTECVITDGGVGSTIHIQVDGGTLNAGLSWATGQPMASATYTAQVTGGTVIMDGHTLYGNGAKAVEGADGTRYATLQEAIDAANDGDTLTLIGSFVINETVNVTKSITIVGGTPESGIVIAGGNIAKDGRAYNTFRVKDGAHLTLDGNVTYYLVGIVMEGGSTVTVKGNTVIDNIRGTSKWSDAIAAPGDGDRTINISGNALLQGDYVISFQGGTGSIFSGTKTVNMTGGKLEGTYGIVVNEGGTTIIATLQNCEIAVANSCLYVDGQYDATNKNTVTFSIENAVMSGTTFVATTGHLSHTTITVDGGEYTATGYGFDFKKSIAKLTIEDGAFTVTGDRFVNTTTNGNETTIVINGGTIDFGSAEKTGHALMFYTNDDVVMNITVNGGTINSYSTEIDEYNATFITNGHATEMHVTLNGGTFNVFNLFWIYHGTVSYKDNGATVNATNRYIIAPPVHYVTADGRDVYGCLAGMVEGAPAGTVITLTGSTDVCSTILVNKDLTIRGDGVSVTGSGVLFKITGAATLTFEGAVSYTSNSHIVRIDATDTPFKAVVNFKGGRFENTKTDGAGDAKTIFSDFAPLCDVEVTIDQGVVMKYNGWGIVNFDSADNAATSTALKKLTINGGSFTGGHGVVVGAKVGGYNAKFEIVMNGGSFNVASEIFWLRSTKQSSLTINDIDVIRTSGVIVTKANSYVDITINGGDFYIDPANQKALIALGGYETGLQGSLTINGGTFNSYRVVNVYSNYSATVPSLTVEGLEQKFDYVIKVTGGTFTSTNRTFSVTDYSHTYLEISGGTFNAPSGNIIYHTDRTDQTDKTGSRGTAYLYAVVTGDAVLSSVGNVFENYDGWAYLTIKADGEGNAPTLTSGSWIAYTNIGDNTNLYTTIHVSAGTFLNYADDNPGGFFGNSASATDTLPVEISVTISGGTFDMDWELVKLNGTCKADITVSGGTYNVSRIFDVVGSYNADVTLAISGGTFTTEKSAIWGESGSGNNTVTVTLSGDTVINTATSVVEFLKGTMTLNISGGTYTAPYSVIVAYGNSTASITGGTFEGLALYTHSALNWKPTIGEGAVINTTHRDYHHATFNDGANSYCGSIEAVAGAVPANSVITIVGQLFNGTYNIGNSVIITGDATATVGNTSGHTQIRPAAGVTVSFIGDVTYYRTTVYGANNVTVTFGGNVRFENGTSYHVFSDESGNNTTKVTVEGNAYLQGKYGINFDGYDSGEKNHENDYQLHTGVKTVIMTGGTIEANYGIVFNVDGVSATISISGGEINANNSAIYLNAGTHDGKRITLTMANVKITAKTYVIVMVDGNTLADITITSGEYRADNYTIDFYAVPNADKKPATLTILGGIFVSTNADAAIYAYSSTNDAREGEAPVVTIYGGYFEAYKLCCARATVGAWLKIYGGYFAYLPELYTNGGSPIRSGTGGGTGHVEIYGGTFYSTAYAPTLNCANDQSFMTVNILGISALGGQYITAARPNSVQYRFPDGDHEYEGMISMIDGAGVRLYPDSNGLRFVSFVTAEALEYIRSLGGTNVRFGTLIAPADEVAKAGAFSIEAMNYAGAQFINIPASNGLVERADGGYYIRAALVNIREENIGRDFAATGYVQYELPGGETITIYTAYRASRNARSIEQAARLALKDADKYTPAQQAILQTFAPTEAAPVIDFYLVAGQSNAAGSSNWNDNIMQLRPEYYEGFSHVLYSGSSNTIHRLNTVTKLGYGSGSDTFGPELGMADALSQYYNEETGRYAVIVKYAYGGTNLYDSVGATSSNYPEGNWLPPSWIAANGAKDERVSGGLFRALVNHVENSIAEYEAMGFDVNIVATYWMQGESDVNSHAADGMYDDIFKCWVNDLRSALVDMTGEEKYASLPILVGEISEYFNRNTEDTYQRNCAAFVQMQREIIGSWDNVYVISNGNIPTDDHFNDTAHWGYHQALWIGQHVGRTILTELLGQEIVVPEDQIVAELWLNGELIGVYSELAGAINQAPEGSVVKILKDLDMYSNMVIGNRNKFTIDGNGHTLTFKTVDGQKKNNATGKYELNRGVHSAMKFYAVDLTIKDLFVVSTNNDWGSQLFMNSKLTWIGGGFEAQELCFVMNDHGALNIHGGEFTTRGTTNSGFGVVYLGSSKTQTLTITDGVFNAGATGAGSAVIVTAATVNCAVTITGGTFIGAPDTDVVIDINSTSATLHISSDDVTVIGGTTAGVENAGNTVKK